MGCIHFQIFYHFANVHKTETKPRDSERSGKHNTTIVNMFLTQPSWIRRLKTEKKTHWRPTCAHTYCFQQRPPTKIEMSLLRPASQRIAFLMCLDRSRAPPLLIMCFNAQRESALTSLQFAWRHSHAGRHLSVFWSACTSDSLFACSPANPSCWVLTVLTS